MSQNHGRSDRRFGADHKCQQSQGQRILRRLDGRSLGDDDKLEQSLGDDGKAVEALPDEVRRDRPMW